MPVSGQRADGNMIENMLIHTNPFHVRDEVTTSDYITMIFLGVFIPLFAVYMQKWVDRWAMGTPVTRGDPRYFVTPDDEGDSNEQKKTQ